MVGLALLCLSISPPAAGQTGDFDADGIANAVDVCPFHPSANQSDEDGNGIGDECECGDQNEDGTVNVEDLLAINGSIFGLQAVSPLCDTNNDDLCNVSDILGANAKIFGALAFCSRYPQRRPPAQPVLTAAFQEPVTAGDDADAAAVYGPARGNAPGSSTILSSGEKRLDRVDLRIPGRGQIHFEFRRRYRSQLDYAGPLGFGWDFNCNERLFIQPGGDVVRSDGSGHQDVWTSLGGGSFGAPDGHLGTLRQELDGSFLLREPDGFLRSYGPGGRLTSHADRHGNSMAFEYDMQGNLARAIDVFGREIQFVFASFPDGIDRLVTLRDHTGREVAFTYSAAGDLAEVRSPLITGTSHGNDFPAGRVERYAYQQGTGTALDHNLLTVTRPEEVATGGPPAITVSYGEDPADADSFDRVTGELVGGTNASGVPAGGTITYAYSAVNQGAGPDPALSRLDVEVTERNGNLLELEINEDEHLIRERRLTRGLRAGEPPFYETVSEFDANGQLTRRVFPEGNELRHTYPASPRAAQGNRIETRRVPDATRGGSERITTRTFEPLYQQLASIGDPRENDPAFIPPIGSKTPGRYVRTWSFDYQEGSAPVSEAIDWGIDLSAVPRGLGDLNDNQLTDEVAGNLVRQGGPTVLLPAGAEMIAVLGDSSQEVVWQWRWNDRGQLLAEIDAEGNQTSYDYHPENDPDGDGVPVPGQASTHASGYLRALTIDAAPTPRRTSAVPPAALETRYSYDPAGFVVELVGPRGVSTRFEINVLGERLVETRGAATAGAIARGELPTGEGPLAYEVRNHYDHNGRRVLRETEDDPAATTTPGVGPWIEHRQMFDINGNLVEESQEVDGGDPLVTRYRYDAHDLRTERHHPRSTQIVDPVAGNVDTIAYDERHLPFLLTEGAGSPVAGTYRLDYGPNGRLESLTDAEDNDGDLLGESTVYRHNGHDELVLTTTTLGTERRLTRDPLGSVVNEQIWGHPGNQPGAPIERLMETTSFRDELDRVCRIDQSLFVSPGVAPQRPVTLIDGNSDGAVTTRVEHDALGDARFHIEDDGEVTEIRYDGARRVAEVVDALQNRIEIQRDAGGNPVVVTEHERSPEGLVADQAFTTYNVFDQLDRLVRTTSHGGHTDRYAYDSRDNVVGHSDPNGELQLAPDPLGIYPGLINDPGNRQTVEYDGAGRVRAVVWDLYEGGLPGPVPILDTSNPFNPDGRIRVEIDWDANGNAVAITDDNSRTTQISYDERDRRDTRMLANGTSYSTSYDRDGNVTTTTDPAGSVVTHTYDGDHRHTQTDVARGPGVVGTTQQTYSYDGMGRQTGSTDDNGGTLMAQILILYDSLSRPLERTQGSRIRPVSYVYEGDGDVEQITYAEGKTYTFGYDAVDRLESISDGSPILDDICYMGGGTRELQRDLGNGARVLHHDEAGTAFYDSLRLIQRVLAEDSGGQPQIDRQYLYDRVGNQAVEQRADDFNQVDDYFYDSANRLREVRVDQAGDFGVSSRDQRVDLFTLDGAGNRRTLERSTASSGTTVIDYVPDAVNAYVSIGGVAQAQDANGNLTSNGGATFDYDFQKRLKKVSSPAGEADYEYDAAGNRVRRTVTDPGQNILVDAESYFDLDGRLLDQWSFVHGQPFLNVAYGPQGPGDVLFFEVTLSGYPFEARTTHVRNPRNDLVGVTDAAGLPVQDFIYDPFGNAYQTSGTSPPPPFLFHGLLRDSETAFSLLPDGYWDPGTGRSIGRDAEALTPVYSDLTAAFEEARIRVSARLNSAHERASEALDAARMRLSVSSILSARAAEKRRSQPDVDVVVEAVDGIISWSTEIGEQAYRIDARQNLRSAQKIARQSGGSTVSARLLEARATAARSSGRVADRIGAVGTAGDVVSFGFTAIETADNLNEAHRDGRLSVDAAVAARDSQLRELQDLLDAGVIGPDDAQRLLHEISRNFEESSAATFRIELTGTGIAALRGFKDTLTGLAGPVGDITSAGVKFFFGAPE